MEVYSSVTSHLEVVYQNPPCTCKSGIVDRTRRIDSIPRTITPDEYTIRVEISSTTDAHVPLVHLLLLSFHLLITVSVNFSYVSP